MNEAPMQRRSSRRGYTMVEVMMGLSILGIGSVSIIGLQKYAAMGTMTNRHITNASSLSASRLETMSAEAQAWTGTCEAANNCNLAATVTAKLGSMPWLGAALVAADGASEGAWGAPTLRGFTIEGVAKDPAAVGGAPVAYCSHVRAAWLGNQNNASAVRLDVRTFFAKSGRDIRTECDPAQITTAQITGLLEATTASSTLAIGGVTRRREEYGVIYMTTILRRPSL